MVDIAVGDIVAHQQHQDYKRDPEVHQLLEQKIFGGRMMQKHDP